MKRVTKQNPCPICGKSDWCLIAEDNSAAICQRVESGKHAGDAGWLHKLTADTRPRRPLKPDPPKPKVDIWPIYRQHQKQMTVELRQVFSVQLGVSERALTRLEAGWDGQCYTFPMRDGNDRVVGISVRGKDRKWCVPGSQNGLFWPVGVEEDLESDKPLWISEGPTDCAALLDLGFDAIGRQGCMGCTKEIVTLLGNLHRKKAIIIMADKDAPKSRQDKPGWMPGLEGANRLASTIAPIALNVKVVLPPHSKDIRQWRNEGATTEMVKAVLNNTRFF